MVVLNKEFQEILKGPFKAGLVPTTPEALSLREDVQMVIELDPLTWKHVSGSGSITIASTGFDWLATHPVPEGKVWRPQLLGFTKVSGVWEISEIVLHTVAGSTVIMGAFTATTGQAIVLPEIELQPGEYFGTRCSAYTGTGTLTFSYFVREREV